MNGKIVYACSGTEFMSVIPRFIQSQTISIYAFAVCVVRIGNIYAEYALVFILIDIGVAWN
jgi:hypothetical protein